MPRPTDSTTGLSLIAMAVADLYPDSLSGEEILNGLGRFTLNGYSATVLIFSAVASHLARSIGPDSEVSPQSCRAG